MSDPELLRQFEICERLAISDETWRRWVKSGKAPQPVVMPGRPRWRVVEIDAFLQRPVVAERPSHRRYFAAARRQHGRTVATPAVRAKGQIVSPRTESA